MQSWYCPPVPVLPGRGPQLRLYDSADRQVRPVAPGSKATMYVCGITPYDATHLGHAATYVTFDLIHRLWLDLGHELHYVQNITDIDDPLFERADRDGVDWRDLAQAEVALFCEDMAALRVLPPQDYVGATEAIAEMVELIEKMLACGAAYVIDREMESTRTSTSALTPPCSSATSQGMTVTPCCGCARNVAAIRGARQERRTRRVVVAGRAPGEPSWPSPFGPGRPGWHVECAAIALSRIGSGLDIQGGGSDLIFPHHEFTAAHAECVSGERRFARHYVHAGMIGWDGHKMSKSRGNLVLVSALRAQDVEPSAVRLGLLAGHYRADRFWSQQVLDEATARLHRWRTATALPAGPAAVDVVARVRRYLADDLDTPKAIAALDGWVTDAVEYGGHDAGAPKLVATAIDALLGVDL
ncbi:cysteine--1-D-myo-inosityl 2-amino-2-deoxy-alpha-D-glucopyranoside ligase [Mycobacterium tuberculosis]